MHTITTPIRSMATTRSGSVGPLISLIKVRPAAAASMVKATADGVVSAPMTPSTKNSEYAAFKTRFDFIPGRIRGGHIHHVHIQELAIGRHVQRDAARSRIDQHRQQ